MSKMNTDHQIDVSITYDDKIAKMEAKNIIQYEILKDSVKRNYNIHLLTLGGLTAVQYKLLNNIDVDVHIRVLYQGHLFKELTCKVDEINTMDNEEESYNIQLVMISRHIYDMLNSKKYVKFTGTGDNKKLITSYELITKVIRQMSIDEGINITGHYNNAGEIKFAHPNITVPKTLNDISLFDYVFEHYPPYFIKPYFIIDDFHKSVSGINIFLNNLCDTNGNYPLRRTDKIKTISLKTFKYLKSKSLFDFANFKKELGSTIYLKNTNNKNVYKLQPESRSARNDNVLNIETQLDVKMYKKILSFKRTLMKYNASVEYFTFDNATLTDFEFGKVYNLGNLNKNDYDMLPCSIYYKFSKGEGTDKFKLMSNVDFIKSPSNLLAS